MVKNYPIVLDLKETFIGELFEVVSQDTESNIFNITIVDNTNNVDLTGHTAKAKFTDSKGSVYEQDCTITDAVNGLITVVLALDTISVEGITTAEISLHIGNVKATSGLFKFKVRNSMENGETIVPTNLLPNYKNDLAEVQGNVDSVQGQLNQVVIGGTDVDPRLSQALVDVEGTSWDVFKEQLDYWYSKINDLKSKIVDAETLQLNSTDSNASILGYPANTKGLFRPGAKGVAPVTNLLGANGTAEIEVASIGAIAYKSIDSTLNLTSDKYILFYNVTTAPATSVRNTPLVKLQDDSSLFQSTTENYNASTGRKVWKFETTQNIKELLWWGHTTDVNPKIKEFMLIQVDDVTYNLSDAELLAKYHYIENTVTCALSYELVSRTQNIFDKDKSINGGYYDPNGIWTDYTGQYSTDYIYCKSDTEYMHNRGTNSYINFYDANKSRISSITAQTFTTPKNARYFITHCSVDDKTIDEFMIVEGNTMPINYIPFDFDKTEFSTGRRMTRIGDMYDEITTDGKLIYRNSDETVLNGSYNWVNHSNLTGLKRVRIDAAVTSVFQNYLANSTVNRLRKNDNKNVPFDGGGTVGDTWNYSGGFFVIAVPNSDTGFTDGVTPTSQNWKDYFNANPYILEYQLAQEETIEDGQQGYKAPYSIHAYQSGDLVQIPTTIKEVNLTAESTITLDYKCISILELKGVNGDLTGTLESDGVTITLDAPYTGAVIAKGERARGTCLNIIQDAWIPGNIGAAVGSLNVAVGDTNTKVMTLEDTLNMLIVQSL
ncbi:BppU family phage baseplate upper protein [Vallitalea pronyensis]|uniref:BppU family phage baseplate upper protein n=1 Tax=Vallitalea pronyensis TaxID=1348613 RepID=A0A8J8SIR0_9FIRM|nr:BppU family phage baseplate upper protein [Vallitalea pronyensis]QUI24866.1 BppU family phage baseplate upper protein [Vallitalea pronyensis]